MKMIRKGLFAPLFAEHHLRDDMIPNASYARMRLVDRLHQSTRCILITSMFYMTLLLLFMLPLYDLITGRFSSTILTMLILSSLLLTYMYVVVCIVGQWHESKQLMKIPSHIKVWICMLLISSVIALYMDLYLETVGLYPYLIPGSMAIILLIIAIVYMVQGRTKKTRL